LFFRFFSEFSSNCPEETHLCRPFLFALSSMQNIQIHCTSAYLYHTILVNHNIYLWNLRSNILYTECFYATKRRN
jgi:hypothetical protein